MTCSWKEKREALGLRIGTVSSVWRLKPPVLNPIQLLSTWNMDSALSDLPIVPESGISGLNTLLA